VSLLDFSLKAIVDIVKMSNYPEKNTQKSIENRYVKLLVLVFTIKQRKYCSHTPWEHDER